jgi:hypothetical protein
MRYLKNFEDSQDIIYTCIIVDKHENSDNFAFYDSLSRDNFIINLIHREYRFDNMYEEVEDIFDVENLIDIYNTDGDNKIYTYESKIMSDVKLDKSIQIRKDAKKYNL